MGRKVGCGMKTGETVLGSFIRTLARTFGTSHSKKAPKLRGASPVSKINSRIRASDSRLMT